ncbi:MAG: inositol monophosphatase family protein, partial [Mangrovicoccus sp.]
MSEELISIAKRLAEAGGKAALTYFRGQGLTADNKSSADFDPVTEGDRAAEQAMRAILAAERPQDGILGEEFGQSQGESGWVWVLDPIDGTRGFLAGTPVWGVLVGLRNAQGPQFGIIEQPFIGERFFGGLGE